MIRVWLLCLLVMAPALADEVTVTIRSQPSGAAVVDNYNDVVGRTGQPITMDIDKKYAGAAHLDLKAEGYLVKKIVLTTPDAGVYPPSGPPLRLEPASWVTVAKEWGAVLAGLTATLLAALGAWRLRAVRVARERQREAEVMEVIRSQAYTDPRIASQEPVGGYRLIGLLGKGGMGTVYRALKPGSQDLSEAVALKAIDMTAGLNERARLLREVELTRSLTHPGLVSLYDAGETEDCLYLVMELVPGQTLRQRLESPLSLAEAWGILEQLLTAVEFAHGHGIVHRDLKPDNVMITPEGRVKVLDFGLARGAQSVRITGSYDLLGTPAYLAPEQALNPTGLDPRTDQYALGLMCYEMLAGRLPFEAGDVMQMVQAHIVQEPDPPSRVNPALPPALDPVILKMLSKDPLDRYANLALAARELRQALGD